MSILECRLAVEKEMDGKPFTICNDFMKSYQ